MDFAGEVLVDSIPGAIVGSIVGLLLVGTHKILTDGSRGHNATSITTNNHSQFDNEKHSLQDSLSFRPALFDTDRAGRFTKCFLTLQEFRNFSPLLFDQAGRLTDVFLGKYKAVCNAEPVVFQHNYLQNCIQLWADIYNKLDEFQLTCLKRLETLDVGEEDVKEMQENMTQSIATIDQHLRQYVHSMDQRLQKLHSVEQNNEQNQQNNQQTYQSQQSQQNNEDNKTETQLNWDQSNQSDKQATKQTENTAKSPSTFSSMLNSILPPDFGKQEINATLSNVGKSLLHQFTQ